MPLDIFTPNVYTTLEDEEVTFLLHFARESEIQAPQFQKIWDQFYQDPCVYESIWLLELRQLREAYVLRQQQRLIRERKISAKQLEVRQRILHELMQQDKWLIKLNGLIAACEDAIATGQSLQFQSD